MEVDLERSLEPLYAISGRKGAHISGREYMKHSMPIHLKSCAQKFE